MAQTFCHCESITFRTVGKEKKITMETSWKKPSWRGIIHCIRPEHRVPWCVLVSWKRRMSDQLCKCHGFDVWSNTHSGIGSFHASSLPTSLCIFKNRINKLRLVASISWIGRFLPIASTNVGITCHNLKGGGTTVMIFRPSLPLGSDNTKRAGWKEENFSPLRFSWQWAQ